MMALFPLLAAGFAESNIYSSDYVPAAVGAFGWAYALLLMLGSVLESRNSARPELPAAALERAPWFRKLRRKYSATARIVVLVAVALTFVLATALTVTALTARAGAATEVDSLYYPAFAHPWVLLGWLSAAAVTALELLCGSAASFIPAWMKPPTSGWRKLVWPVVVLVCVFGTAFLVLAAEIRFFSGGLRWQPWVHNTALVFLLICVGIFILCGFVLLIRLLVVMARGRYWLIRVAAVIPALAGVGAMIFAGLLMFVVFAFGVVDGERFTLGGRQYLNEAVWLDTSHTCFRYEGWFVMAPSACKDGPDSVSQGISEGEQWGNPQTAESAEPQSEAETGKYCEDNPQQCFPSVWKRAPMRIADAERQIVLAQPEVQRIGESKYGWVMVDAAAGARWVFLVEEKFGEWQFVSEFPSTHGVAEASVSGGELRLSNQDGTYVFHVGDQTWVKPGAN